MATQPDPVQKQQNQKNDQKINNLQT